MWVYPSVSAAPDDPPQNLTSIRGITEVIFKWVAPSVPNGIICWYTFSIFTAGYTTTKGLSANQTIMRVDGFNSHQLYSVNVTASTCVNGFFADSPPAVLMEFTFDRDSEYCGTTEFLFVHIHTHTQAQCTKLILKLSTFFLFTWNDKIFIWFV